MRWPPEFMHAAPACPGLRLLGYAPQTTARAQQQVWPVNSHLEWWEYVKVLSVKQTTSK